MRSKGGAPQGRGRPVDSEGDKRFGKQPKRREEPEEEEEDEEDDEVFNLGGDDNEVLQNFSRFRYHIGFS